MKFEIVNYGVSKEFYDEVMHCLWFFQHDVPKGFVFGLTNSINLSDYVIDKGKKFIELSEEFFTDEKSVVDIYSLMSVISNEIYYYKHGKSKESEKGAEKYLEDKIYELDSNYTHYWKKLKKEKMTKEKMKKKKPKDFEEEIICVTCRKPIKNFLDEDNILVIDGDRFAGKDDDRFAGKDDDNRFAGKDEDYLCSRCSTKRQNLDFYHCCKCGWGLPQTTNEEGEPILSGYKKIETKGFDRNSLICHICFHRLRERKTKE